MSILRRKASSGSNKSLHSTPAADDMGSHTSTPGNAKNLLLRLPARQRSVLVLLASVTLFAITTNVYMYAGTSTSSSGGGAAATGWFADAAPPAGGKGPGAFLGDAKATEKARHRPTVTEVGYQTKDYDSRVKLSDLQPLYLPPTEDSAHIAPGAAMEDHKRKVVWPLVKTLPHNKRLRCLVTGGAGFVGSHLVDRLMIMGHEVIVADNYFTGDKRNVAHWIGHPHFELIRHDVIDPLAVEVDRIYHLACPASPPHYQYNPIKTVKTSVMGTINMLGLARRVKARFLVTSTSEVYGDPEVHPQVETYWGHVNPIGPRACYDEGKRVAETLTYSYQQQEKIAVRVARIFNTFGPRMNQDDGRVVSNFIMQSLRNTEPLTIYGDGQQTRSFQYVHDLVDGLISLMEHAYTEPVNLGNPDEYTIADFATTVNDLVGLGAEIKRKEGTEDDPRKRQPDITRARTELAWEPKFSVEQGLKETVAYFKGVLKEEGTV